MAQQIDENAGLVPYGSRLEHAVDDWSDLILQDRETCGGEPVVKGTRVTVRTVTASLAEGMTVEDLLREFPTLTEDGVRAAIEFAAARFHEGRPESDPPDAA